MMNLSLSQAAKLTNKSKSTINRAIKTGKISAIRQDDGSYSIDPSELHRVFGVEPPNAARKSTEEPAEPRLADRIEALELMLQREREITADLKEDRDRWRQQATALLTDQRPPKATTNKWWPWRR